MQKPDDSTPTRRAYLTTTAGIAAGLLAGCTGGSDTGTTTDGSEASETTETTATDDETTEPASADADSGPYTAAIEPMGEVEFESVPETWIGGLGFAADVLTALGQADGAVGMVDERFWYTGFYDELPGVSVPAPDDLPRITTSDRKTKVELVYDLDPDVIAADPNGIISIYSLKEGDATRIHEDVAPFFGNGSRRKRWSGWTYWPDGEEYRYYSLPEFVTKYGEAFQQQERAAAMRGYYEDRIDAITSRVPPESERRTVGLLNGQYNPENRDGWIVYDPTSEKEMTWGKKQYRDLGAVDAFEGAYGGSSSVTLGYEGLLKHDPDVIVFHFGVTYSDFDDTDLVQQQIEHLKDDELGQQLTAVRNDDLYVGGTPYQGPIINLFQTEMTAKQLYPDEYGEFPGLGEIPEDEQLFSRQRLSDIVAGNL